MVRFVERHGMEEAGLFRVGNVIHLQEIKQVLLSRDEIWSWDEVWIVPVLPCRGQTRPLHLYNPRLAPAEGDNVW